MWDEIFKINISLIMLTLYFVLYSFFWNRYIMYRNGRASEGIKNICAECSDFLLSSNNLPAKRLGEFLTRRRRPHSGQRKKEKCAQSNSSRNRDTHKKPTRFINIRTFLTFRLIPALCRQNAVDRTQRKTLLFFSLYFS